MRVYLLSLSKTFSLSLSLFKALSLVSYVSALMILLAFILWIFCLHNSNLVHLIFISLSRADLNAFPASFSFIFLLFNPFLRNKIVDFKGFKLGSSEQKAIPFRLFSFFSTHFYEIKLWTSEGFKLGSSEQKAITLTIWPPPHDFNDRHFTNSRQTFMHFWFFATSI